ncbi:sugar ABC transporter permease [Aminobacter sp. MSH1]|uniref:carbohydrate ABC transporter permease n=1 Tax=Aminobacter sp. MSH1 TaxID=374606 RepID=UPI000D3711E9|nr:sugar ABC transporter permease [Aminobacter sp. MSH1]
MAQDIAPSQPNLWPYILPTVLVLGACTLYPIGTVLWMSLHDWTWGGDSVFSGLKNYRLLWVKGSFLIALVNTITFAVSAVLVELVLGMVLALAANRVTTGAGIFRVLMILPLMVSGIAVSLVWKVLLDPNFGVINAVLGALHLPGPNWLGSTAAAMPSLVMVETWWQTGFVFIILAAALKGLPEEPFEAARLEGASGWQTFRYLTLPMLRPVIVTVVVFRLIDTLKVFDLVFGLTGGGPLRRTEAVQTLTYQTAFKFSNFGEAAAIVVIFSALIFAICATYGALDRRMGGSE